MGIKVKKFWQRELIEPGASIQLGMEMLEGQRFATERLMVRVWGSKEVPSCWAPMVVQSKHVAKEMLKRALGTVPPTVALEIYREGYLTLRRTLGGGAKKMV